MAPIELPSPQGTPLAAAPRAPAGLVLLRGRCARYHGLPLPAQARAAPESFADLAEQVTGAVVNISASTTVEARNRTLPQLPPGTPFEDLFEEFFNRRGQGGGRATGRSPRSGQRRSNSLGSGFVIDPSGIVVTNNHVIGDANDISVIFSDGTRLKAEIIGKDSKVDLAVLKVKVDKPLKAVPFGNSDVAASGRLGDGDRQPVRPRRLGHGRHRLGPGPQHRFRPLRQLHPDRRLHQQGQFGRPAVQHERRGHRHQHGDPVADRRLGRHRLRGARLDRRARSSSSSASSARPAAAGSACASRTSTTPPPRP